LEATDEKSRIRGWIRILIHNPVHGSRIRILPQNVTDPEHCFKEGKNGVKDNFFYIQEDEEEELEEELEDERLRQQAVAERERGNALFKAGKYDLAVEKYTAGHYRTTARSPWDQSFLSCPVQYFESNELGFFLSPGVV